MRKIILIRHGRTDGTRYDRDRFSAEGAPLNDEGVLQVSALRAELEKLGLDFLQPVATSEKIRTKQTAQHSGFTNLNSYKSLNEIEYGSLTKEYIESCIAKKKVPEPALIAAKKLLNNPPKESIWFTHGMLIAAIAEIIGIPKDELFIPDFASLNTITLP